MHDVARLISPSMRCARVVFIPNLARQSNEGAVPLGVFCEIRTAEIRGLALKARTRLAESELKAIALVFQKLLANPFDFFSSEFDAAWTAGTKGGGYALDFLSNKHAGSLSVLAPYHPAAANKHYWWRSLFGEPETDSLLKEVVYGEFDRLIANIPSWDGPTPPPTLRMQLAEAA
jgi:hypothetical protein